MQSTKAAWHWLQAATWPSLWECHPHLVNLVPRAPAGFRRNCCSWWGVPLRASPWVPPALWWSPGPCTPRGSGRAGTTSAGSSLGCGWGWGGNRLHSRPSLNSSPKSWGCVHPSYFRLNSASSRCGSPPTRCRAGARLRLGCRCSSSGTSLSSCRTQAWTLPAPESLHCSPDFHCLGFGQSLWDWLSKLKWCLY